MAEDAGIVAEAPDWEHLEHELHCPRCGYNLRMLPEPRCPECGLRFEWAELVESTERQAKSPLFEYHWHRRPIRSFFVTVGWAMVPWVLWRRTRITWEPRIGPLVVLLLIMLVLDAIRALGVEFIHNWIAISRYVNFSGFPSWDLDYVGVACRVLGNAATAFLVWLALQIFQQTIARYRLRQRQLLRVLVLAATGCAAWQVVGSSIAIPFELLEFGPRGFPYTRYAECADWSIHIGVATFVLSLCLGLSVYLKIRRGWLMGLASLLTVFLSLVAIGLLRTPGSVLERGCPWVPQYAYWLFYPFWTWALHPS